MLVESSLVGIGIAAAFRLRTVWQVREGSEMMACSGSKLFCQPFTTWRRFQLVDVCPPVPRLTVPHR